MIRISGLSLACLILMIAAAGVSGEAPEIASVTTGSSGSRIFVHTRPPGARVYVNEIEQTGRTPMIIEAADPDLLRLTVQMSGFRPEELELKTGAGIVTAVEYSLTPTGGIVVPPGAEGSEAVSLDAGRYDLGLREDLESLIPVYPHQQWIDGLNIAIPVVSVLAGGILLGEALAPESDGRISPYTIALLSTDLLLIGADIGFHIHRSGWREEWVSDPASGAPAWAAEDFEAAMEAFNSGNLDEAGVLFDRFALRYPLNEHAPEAVYLSARVSFLTGDLQTARSRLELMERRYPVPSLWGRSRKLHAEILFRSGETEQGLAMMKEIYGFDESVDRESTDLTRTRIIAERALAAGDTAAAAAAWDELIAAWPDSVLAGEYRSIRDSLSPDQPDDQERAAATESSGPSSP